jgi:hypothetical protein
MTDSQFIHLVSGAQQAVPHIPTWNTATIVADPTFIGGVETDWWVSLGPLKNPQAVFLIGAGWDPLGPVGFNWIRADPMMIIWQPFGRDWRFQRRDFVHAVCTGQVLECSAGIESVDLTVFF